MSEQEIVIISKEIIKPSKPTPPHPKTFKFSLINQLIRQDATPVHLFFNPPNTDNPPPPDHLKRSLEDTLTRFYPLAGIITKNSYIHCTDQGAIYYDARVDSPMHHFLNRHDHDFAKALKLLQPSLDDQAILTVQVTTFSCRSIVICACISHKIADAAAFATFFNCWGAFARGGGDGVKGVVVDSCHVFPLVDASSLGDASRVTPNSGRQSLLATKRFVFTPQRISSLQETLSIGTAYRPSRVLALSALIWGSFIRITQHKNDHTTPITHVASHALDLRNRTSPKLPGDSVNNLVELSMGAEWAGSTPVDFAKLASLMKGDIKRFDDAEFVKRIHSDGTYTSRRSKLVSGSANGQVKWFKFTSNCRVPYYETDFGWGTPCWAASAVVPLENFCVLLDAPPCTASGAVEAWIVLLNEDMKKLEKDQFFMGFVDRNSQSINARSKL